MHDDDDDDDDDDDEHRVSLIKLHAVQRMDNKATQVKFVCPCMSL